ncbi:MAG: hypothetical protein SV062_05220 [Thermodesulfobacteriota bacterium]|nr:hypothetical protein [Thermodesulfobacteriota bacterium]
MGEIKSTLDIIMNKVKNINVSPEEKRIWKDKEIRKKADSMLEKLLSNQIKLYQFEDEVEKISQEDKKSLVGFLMDGLLNRVQIYNTPEEVFSALSVFLKNKSEDIIISRIKSQISFYALFSHKGRFET